MFFRKYIALFLLGTAGFTAHAQTDTTTTIYTLQRCLEIAIRNNLQVKQDKLTQLTDSINFVQAKDNLLPTINAQASRTLSQGRALSPITNTYINQGLTSDNYYLTGNLLLFGGLSNQNAIKQARLAYEAGKMDFQAAKDIVTVNIITAYLTVLDDEEQLAQTKSQLAVAKETVDRGELLEKQGANTTASTIYDLRGSYANSEVALVNGQNAILAAKVALFQYMNIPYKNGADLQPLNAQDLIGDYGSNPDQIYETALAQLAVVKAATLRREAAEKAVKQAQGLLLPSLNLNGGISTNYSSAGQSSTFIDSTATNTGLYINTPTGKQSVYANEANYATQNINYINQFKNNYGTYVGLTLSIPILNYRQKRNAVALAKINLLTLKNVEDNTKVQLQQNIEQAFSNMVAAYNRFKALQNESTAYSESFRISKLRFESGVLNSVDYVTAKNNMDAANLALISAQYDYFIYSKVLDYYQGKLNF